MASITLAEASKLGLDDLVSGVIENIVTVNDMYSFLPFQDINGNAKAYNRENALGDAQALAIGGTITAKAAASYTQVTTPLTTIIGDAEVNGLLQAQRVGANGGNDLVAAQIASKAKSVGREYQRQMVVGDTGNAGEFDGLVQLVPAGQQITATDVLSYTDLDALLHAVKSKGGQVDFLMMPSRTIRAKRALDRALGGTTGDQVTVNGITMEAYAGVPIFRNDYIPTDVDNSGGTGTATDTYVFAGNFDDGSETVGIAGLTSAQNMGIHVEPVGAMESKDEHIWRIKFYSSFAMYSGLSVAMLKEVSN